MQRFKSLITSLKTNSIFFGAIIFGVVLLSVWYVDFQFSIKNITVNGKSSSESKIFGLDQLFEKNNLLISENTESNILLKLNPLIQQIQITKQLPNSLELVTSSRTPYATLLQTDGYLILDRTGVIVDKWRKTTPPKYPVIEYYQHKPLLQWSIGSKVGGQDIIDSLTLFAELSKLGIRVKGIDISSFNMLGLYTSSEEYIFSSERDISLQVYQLKEVLKQLKINGRKIKKLDLRFDKPVLTF